MTSSALSRFLRYVTFDTRSDEQSATVPEHAGPTRAVARARRRAQSAWAGDAAMDEHGYVMATIPATAGREDAPVDRLHRARRYVARDAGRRRQADRAPRYDGRDLVLPDDPGAVLRAADNPALAAQIGTRHRDRVGPDAARRGRQGGRRRNRRGGRVSDGAPRDSARPRCASRSRPTKRSAAAPNHFDVDAFRRASAPTRSTAAGAANWSSRAFRPTRSPSPSKASTRIPGYAKGRMVNAIRVAADFVARLPRDRMSPETTDGYDGYLHPYQMQASVDRTSVKVLVRDFVTARLKEKEALVERLARDVVARCIPGASVEFAVEESYRNMREVLEQHPQVVEYAREAIRLRGHGAGRAADPRRHRRIAPVVHGPADAEPVRRRAQLPLAARVGVGAGHGQGGRGDREAVRNLGDGGDEERSKRRTREI